MAKHTIFIKVEVDDEQLHRLVPSGTIYIDLFSHDGHTIIDNVKAEVTRATEVTVKFFEDPDPEDGGAIPLDHDADDDIWSERSV